MEHGKKTKLNTSQIFNERLCSSNALICTELFEARESVFLLEAISMDCKVQIRRYVLIASPSKWAQRGARVVVQSPVPNITNELVIPVRRFKGDKENSVCFMPVQDIEKDGSIAYKDAKITSETKPIDAHGVSLFKSCSDFDYRPGDKFWLFITTKGDDFENDVPVINLRTMASGSVPISHVCWFPKMRGPGNEVWTFGGNMGELRHSEKTHLTSWGICQYLDGEPATSREIQMPKRNINTDEQRWLSSSDARPLFSQIQETMTSNHNRIISPTLPAHSSPSRSEHCKVLLQALYKSPKSLCEDKDNGSSVRTLTFEKLDQVRFTSKGTPGPLQNCLIHPQRTLSSPNRRKYRRIEVDDTQSDSGYSDKTAISSIELSGLAMETGDLYQFNDDLGRLIRDEDGEGTSVALILKRMLLHKEMMAGEVAKRLERKQMNNTDDKVLSAAHPLIRTNPTIISERYQIKKNAPGIEFLTKERNRSADLCDCGNGDCKWSLRFTSRHYHPDHRKCRNANNPDHEHCVSAERALPSRAGSCFLNEGIRPHECCVWKEDDTKDWHHPIIKEDIIEKKILAARQSQMASIDKKTDTTEFIKDESKNIKLETWTPSYWGKMVG